MTKQPFRAPIPQVALFWRSVLLAIACWGGVFVFSLGCPEKGWVTTPMAECGEDGDCQPGAVCFGGSCLLGVCDFDSGCVAPLVCSDTARGVCVECSVFDACADPNDSCLLGRCVECDIEGGMDCDPGFTCHVGACVPFRLDQLVNTTTAGDQSLPALATSIQTVVVWLSSPGSGLPPTVRGQRFDLAFIPQGDELQVNLESVAAPPGNRGLSRPDVAIDSNGEFLVAWVEETDTGGVGPGTRIRGQLYQADGTPDGGEIQLDESASIDKLFPAVAKDDDVFVAVWEAADSEGGGIYARRFQEGNPPGPEFLVNTTEAGDQRLPDVAIISGEPSFVVSWQSEGQDGSGWGVVARLYNPDGTPATGEININESTVGNQLRPAAGTSFSSFAVAWEDVDQREILFRIFDPLGVAVTSETVANSTTEGLQKNPALAMDSLNGNFVVAFEGPDSNLEGVFSRRFQVDGTPNGVDASHNFQIYGPQTNPAVAVLADGNPLAAWEDQDGDGLGIFARNPFFGRSPDSNRPLRAAEGPGFTFATGPSPMVTLGSRQPNASSWHRLHLEIHEGDLEPYSALWAYPSEFSFNGFLALGPAGTPVGSYSIDGDGDGQPELVADILSLNDTDAFIDVNDDGDPTRDPGLIHWGPGPQFAAFAPLGGDAEATTLFVPQNATVEIELLAGLIVNPPTEGAWQIPAILTSVDPDTDDSDDGTGASPLDLETQWGVAIAEVGIIFEDGFESGDTGNWAN